MIDRTPQLPINEETSTINEESFTRNGETSTRLAHYDEIDSSYYNPQDTRNTAHQEIQQPLNSNANRSNSETNTFSSHTRYSVHQLQRRQEKDSPRSSSDNSYLVPCRSDINIDLESDNENECFASNTVIAEIHVQEESSVSSNSSETDIKGILKYEQLQLSHVNEHEYQDAKS